MSIRPRHPGNQVPYDLAVVMTGIHESGFDAAIRSVFAQDCHARIQVLIGPEPPDSIGALVAEAPAHIGICVFDAPPNIGRSRLQAAMAYAANGRYIAYLDHRTRYASRHLRDLRAAAQSRNGAISGLAGMVDATNPAILLIDKLHVPQAPGVLADSGGVDGLIALLRAGRGLGETGRATVFPAALSPDPMAHPRIDAYFAAHQRYRLLVGGSAPPPAGWLGYAVGPEADDTTIAHGKDRLPFLDAVFDQIVLRHGLRSLSLTDGRHLLGECFRILRPGGRAFVAERDLSLLLRLPAVPSDQVDRDHIAEIRRDAPAEAVFDPLAFAINRLFADGGRPTVYDRALLGAMLHSVGFAEIRSASSDALSRAGIDPFADTDAVPSTAFETVILSAARPMATPMA